MCGICVMTAAAGATGARAGLQQLRYRWLTRRRLRAITIGLAALAVGVSSVGFSGSTAAPPAHAHAQSASVR
jgi:hypothetical protein